MSGIENLEPGDRSFFVVDDGELQLMDPDEDANVGKPVRKRFPEWEKKAFLAILPEGLRDMIMKQGVLDKLGDVVLDLGRKVVLRYRTPKGDTRR